MTIADLVAALTDLGVIGVITLGAIKKPNTKGNFVKDPLNLVVVPAVARKLHVKLLENYDRARVLAEKSESNFITGSGDWGIICSGVGYNYVSDAVKDLNIGDKIKVLRIGWYTVIFSCIGKRDHLLKNFSVYLPITHILRIAV